MILKVTERCDMSCSHCLSDCKKEGRDMDLEMFDYALKWATDHWIEYIIITGGEPFMHPDILTILDHAENYLKHGNITVATNGEWLLNNKRQAKKIFNIHKDIIFQITNDQRYYSRKVDLKDLVFKRMNVFCTDKLDHIYPQGRALNLHDIEVLSMSGKCAKCTNMNLVMIQLYRDQNLDLKELFSQYEKCNKFCSPQVKVNGEISFGESDLCGTVGNIYMDDEEILKNAFNNPCEKCRDIMTKNGRLFIGKGELDHIKIAMGLS